MFEHKSQPVLSNAAFAQRMLFAFVVTLLIVGGSIAVGTAGYHWISKMAWDDAFHHACHVLSGHDVMMQSNQTVSENIFSGLFVLYARLVFVSILAVLMVPLIHRMMHKMHLDVHD